MDRVRAESIAASFSGEELRAFANYWPLWAHDAQLPPEGDWTTWLLIGGRGAGKTRAGAEWVRALATGPDPVSPIALVGETRAEARAVMVEGVSGLLAVHPAGEGPRFHAGRGVLVWPNGVEAVLLPASDPDRFRGPQFAAAWCDELGCAAVDKGPNAPNAFGDPKSAEDRRPPFSSGLPDTLIQRQMLRACHDHWANGGEEANPVSPIYDGPMVDPGRLYLWCWDARPYPAFPGFSDVWADAANHATGHWLNGRLGAAGIGEVLTALAGEYGVPVARADAFPPLVEGLTLDGVVSLRDAAAALADAGGLAVRDGVEGIGWIRPDPRQVLALDRDGLMRRQGPLLARRRGDPAESAGRLSLSFADRERDYQIASVTAVAHKGEHTAAVASGLVLDPGGARLAAEGALARLMRAADTIDTAVPPSLLSIEPGDLVAVAGEADGPFVVSELRDGLGRALGAKAHGEPGIAAIAPPERRGTPVLPGVAADPAFRFAHLPQPGGGTALAVAAYAEPWPGAVDIREADTGTVIVSIGQPGIMGVLDAPMGTGPAAVWWFGQALEVSLFDGHLSAQPEAAVLVGANRIAVALEGGGWEVVGFAHAELAGPGRYRLEGLLRGLGGTPVGTAEAGSPVLVLDGPGGRVEVSQDRLGTVLAGRAHAGPFDIEGTAIAADLDMGPALPLAPVHLRAVRDAVSGDIALGWIRRSRVDGDVWAHGDVPLDFAPEAYRVGILDGDTELRAVETAAPALVYTAAQQLADFGGPAGDFTFAVRQLSAVLGPGHEARKVVS